MIRQGEPLWRIIVFVTALFHIPAVLTGLCKVASAMPGTRLLFGGFYKVRFSLNEAVAAA